MNAKEMADYYVGVFPWASIVKENPIVVEIEIFWQSVGFINGWPDFTPNPSISFSLWIKDKELTKQIWDKLMDGGSVMMEFAEYPWSKAYGRGNDKYNVSWQVMYDDRPDHEQALVPSVMYTWAVAWKAEEAMSFYTNLFPKAAIGAIHRYGAGEGDVEGTIAHAEFTLVWQTFIAMDSSMPHKFTFNEWVSLAISCKDQEEVDQYWNALIADGGKESQCGRCKDKYGVDWQVTPVQLPQALFQADQEKAQYAMQAMMKMKKIVIEDLIQK